MVFQGRVAPIIIIDPVQGIVDCNMAAVQMYGHQTHADVLGKMPLAFFGAYPVRRHRQPDRRRAMVGPCPGRRVSLHLARPAAGHGEIWDADVHLMVFEAGGRSLLRLTIGM